MLRARYTDVVTSRHHGGQLRGGHNIERGERILEEVQTLYHGCQLCSRATRARADPSAKDQGRAEQRRPAHQEAKG